MMGEEIRKIENILAEKDGVRQIIKGLQKINKDFILTLNSSEEIQEVRYDLNNPSEIEAIINFVREDLKKGYRVSIHKEQMFIQQKSSKNMVLRQEVMEERLLELETEKEYQFILKMIKENCKNYGSLEIPLTYARKYCHLLQNLGFSIKPVDYFPNKYLVIWLGDGVTKILTEEDFKNIEGAIK